MTLSGFYGVQAGSSPRVRSRLKSGTLMNCSIGIISACAEQTIPTL